MKNEKFEEKMKSVKKDAWVSFKGVTQTFLGVYKDPNYATIIEKMLQNFQKLGCKVKLKIHFLQSHLEYFLENLGEMSKELGERFRQDIK